MTELQRLQMLLDYFNEQAKQCEKQFYTFPNSEDQPNYYQMGRAAAFNKSAFMIQCQIEQLENPTK